METLVGCETQTEKAHPWVVRLFRVGMYWRVAYGVAKTILGIAVLRWSSLTPSTLFYRTVQEEIIEDPTDLFIRIVQPFIGHLSIGTTVFVGLYLLFWGVLDVGLSFALLKRQRWAFLVSFWLIGLFVLYESYRVVHTRSLILAGIIALDLLILWLIYREWRLIRPCRAR